MSDPGPLIGAAFLSAVVIAGGIFATDTFYYGSKEKDVADQLAANSITLDNAPQTTNVLSADLQAYDDNDAMMKNWQNFDDLTTAKNVGLKFWNIPVENGGNDGLDLGKSFGGALVDLATKKVNDARAIIDNRDPEVGPVLVYDRLTDTEFSSLMKSFRKNGWESPADIPEGFAIVVDFFGPGKTVTFDPEGEKVFDTKFGDLVKESPWNEKMKQENKVKGFIRGLIPSGS